MWNTVVFEEAECGKIVIVLDLMFMDPCIVI